MSSLPLNFNHPSWMHLSFLHKNRIINAITKPPRKNRDERKREEKAKRKEIGRRREKKRTTLTHFVVWDWCMHNANIAFVFWTKRGKMLNINYWCSCTMIYLFITRTIILLPIVITQNEIHLDTIDRWGKTALPLRIITQNIIVFLSTQVNSI